MTSDIKWALSPAWQSYSTSSLSCPSRLPGDFYTCFCLLKPVSSPTADGLHGEIEAIRVPSSSHHRPAVPASSAFSPVVMLRLRGELSRPSPRQGSTRASSSFPSPLPHRSHQQEAAFPQPKSKQRPLDPQASLSYCHFSVTLTADPPSRTDRACFSPSSVLLEPTPIRP